MLKHWVGGQGSSYHDAVWRAVIDTEEQAVFRRAPAYHDILGVADYHAREYLKQIDDATVKRVLFASENDDRIGSPYTFDFDGHQLAANTVRYAKVLQDLTRFFPSYPSYQSIAEIGVGYGGQARMVSEYAKQQKTRIQRYDLIDILPVCLLAQGYLDHFRMYATCRYLTKSQIPRDGSWDLVVSNYAFSEFDRDLEHEYLDHVLLRSRSGYLTMNSGLSDSGQWQVIGQSCIGVEELLSILPNAVLLPEKPALTPSNYIIVYGEHSLGDGVPLAEVRRIEAELLVGHNQWLENMERARKETLSDTLLANDSDTQRADNEVNHVSGRKQYRLPFLKSRKR